MDAIKPLLKPYYISTRTFLHTSFGILLPPWSSPVAFQLTMSFIINTILFILALIYMLIQFSKKSGKPFDPRAKHNVLITGPSSRSSLPAPGKTSLFKQLKLGAMPKNGVVTSMEPYKKRFVPVGWNEDVQRIAPSLAPSAGAGTNTNISAGIEFVDFPGHPSQRLLLDSALLEARAVVFLVDSVKSRFQANLREYTRMLYDVLTHGVVSSFETPVLVFCNKTDEAGAMTMEAIRKDLESELDRERLSRESEIGEIQGFSDTSGSRSGGKKYKTAFLGYKNERFSFDHSYSKVTFAAGSVVKNEGLSEIKDFVLTSLFDKRI